jgi:hypothetical protein
MRRLFLFAWFLLPVAAGAYHYGPGQDRLRDDRTEAAIERATEAARQARETAARECDQAATALWLEAVEAYDEALSLVRDEHTDVSRSLQLERAKAQMFVSKLPEARRDLENLVDELQADPKADPKLLADARDALGNAQFYTTWLMRLEGAPREEWEPEIESARQNYKLLAEAAEHSGDAQAATKAKENLESAIKLARMDLSELQGLPLPSQ